MAATAKPEPGSRVSSLAWGQPLRSVDRKGAGRNASERIDSPEIERDRSGRPDLSTGKAASRYRAMASGSGHFRGSYRWHVTEGLDVNKGDPSGSGASLPTSRQGKDGPMAGRKSDQLIVLRERESQGEAAGDR